jgi:hypothetical protein
MKTSDIFDMTHGVDHVLLGCTLRNVKLFKKQAGGGMIFNSCFIRNRYGKQNFSCKIFQVINLNAAGDIMLYHKTVSKQYICMFCQANDI